MIDTPVKYSSGKMGMVIFSFNFAAFPGLPLEFLDIVSRMVPRHSGGQFLPKRMLRGVP